MYYDREGNPLTLEEWAQVFEEGNRVAYTKAGNYSVSTVWLGAAHGRNAEGAPYIFESLVQLAGEESTMVRYTTLEEAERGHERLVEEFTRSRFAKLARKAND